MVYFLSIKMNYFTTGKAIRFYFDLRVFFLSKTLVTNFTEFDLLIFFHHIFL